MEKREQSPKETLIEQTNLLLTGIDQLVDKINHWKSVVESIPEPDRKILGQDPECNLVLDKVEWGLEKLNNTF